jgi:aspartate 1-decarboxylase
VLAFALADPDEAATIKPRVVVLDEHNAIVDQWDG